MLDSPLFIGHQSNKEREKPHQPTDMVEWKVNWKKQRFPYACCNSLISIMNFDVGIGIYP